MLLFSWLHFCLQFLFCEIGRAADPATAHSKVLDRTVNLAKRIISDPLMPAALKGATLRERQDEFTADDPSEPTDDFKVAKFNIILPRNNIPPSQRTITLAARDSGQYSLFMYLSNDDVTEISAEPAWGKLQPEWDKFINRYWPGMQRRTSWQDAVGDYLPGTGVFSILYTIEEQELRLAVARLKVRLADGRIGGIDYADYRPFIRKELKGKPVPPPVSKQTLTAAVDKALKSRVGQTGGAARLAFTNVRLKHSVRRYSVSEYPDEPDSSNSRVRSPFGLRVGMTLEAEGPGQQKYTILAEYDEGKKEAVIGGIGRKEPEPAPDSRKPLTAVNDVRPAWSADGKKLYFTTTRDVKGRPWWNRSSILQSIGICNMGAAAPEVTLIRPVKPLEADIGAYGVAVPSPSGRYLLTSLESKGSAMSLLDLENATLLLPDRSAAWKAEMLKILPGESYLPQGYRWPVASADWLPADAGIVLGTRMDWPDADLYLAKPNPENSMQYFDLKAVAATRAEEILPCLSEDGKVLTYAEFAAYRNVSGGQTDKAWRIITGAFDSQTGEFKASADVKLASEPGSVSWDSINKRWLVATKTGLLWLTQVGNRLKQQKIPDLMWKDSVVQPTSASINAKGDSIAIAGRLAKPIIDKNSEAYVSSTIFLWDGKSNQLQPAFDPSLNQLKRHEFPGKGATWATIVGNVKHLGLDQSADPAFIRQDN